jgi:hypothetical protein
MIRLRLGRLGHQSAIASLVAIATACVSHDTTAPAVSAAIQPLCKLGCIETDPNPEADGYYLGSGVSDETCFNGSQTDSDQDGASDFCEFEVAAAFAPELMYYQYDEVGRQPYWVARPYGDGVMVGYLLSYYRDAGSNSFGCHLPGHPSSCDGHNGDSESIFLAIHYNEGTHHWVLSTAAYSQHEGRTVYGLSTCGVPGPGGGCYYLEWPNKFGGYPRAWVAEGKHGSYATKNECNYGGTVDSDTCDDNDTPARVFVSGNRNIGSRAHQTINCTIAEDPAYQYYGSGRQECYWSALDSLGNPTSFRGWIPESVGGPASSAYDLTLTAFDF